MVCKKYIRWIIPIKRLKKSFEKKIQPKKTFESKNIFDKKLILTKICQTQPFVDQNFFWLKTFLDQNVVFTKKKLRKKNTKKYVLTQNFENKNQANHFWLWSSVDYNFSSDKIFD